MKALGVVQYEQKKFKLLNLDGSPFKEVFGNIEKHFICVIGGFSGNGKTEMSLQFAKTLCKHGKVAWVSYEQRHGYDLQTAIIRNNMREVSGSFIPIDPIANKPKGVSYLEDLDNYLSKRNSPDYIFIDSLDYTGWRWDDYIYLKEKFAGKKTLIFLCHTDKAGNCRKTISTDIYFDGGLFILVQKYIATPIKNRYGGFEPYVIWEKKARELNPLFFDPKNKVKVKSDDKQTELFDNSKGETKGVKKNEDSENKGVNAKSNLKKVG
jgi:hypothetical protein